METAEAVTLTRTRASGLSAETATGRQRGGGIAMMLSGASVNQTGAALGTMAFPMIGAVGVVAVRQLVTAMVLLPTVRPRVRGLRRDQWLPVLGLGLVFSTMNLSLYLAIDRIGLGLAVTLEFLGPLVVAAVGSRRMGSIAGIALAALGVVVLTDPGSTTDVLGVALALTAATAWGSYILLNRSLGQRLPGLEGTALASVVTAGLWLPIAIAWFAHSTVTPRAILLAVGCALLSSVVPYVADLQALRRVPAGTFGALTSINPVFAAFAGLLLLGQTLEVHAWIGIGLIVVSNVVVTTAGRVGRRPLRPGVAGRR